MQLPLILLLAAVLSGCSGNPPPGQAVGDFWHQHTACDPTMYSTPRWSADGARVIYGVSRGAKNSIRWADASGGGDHLVVDDAFAPLPSPDGRWLLYLTTNQQGSPVPYSSLLDLSTMTTQNLVGYMAGAASWSPDSRWIAYNPPNGPLIKVDVETGEPVTLVDDPTETAIDFTPQWSPDSEHILFVAGIAPDQGLYVVSADGSGIAAELSKVGEPGCTTPDKLFPVEEIGAWAPDGESIFLPRVCGSARLHHISLDGQEISGKFASFSYTDRMIWSPDRTKYLLLHFSYYGGQLTFFDADGSAMKKVQQDVRDADWAPDGSRIAIAGDDGNGLSQIYVINPDGTGVIQLTDNPGMGGICLH